MATTIPSILYKYVGSRPHHLDILRNLKIRFTQPDDLNDPFDCVPAIVPPVDVAKFVDATFTRNKDEIARRGYSAEQVAAGRAHMINEYTNNPKALVARCFEVVRKNMNQFGVLSVASHNDNMAMWAHYGETHRGFVIGLRTDGAPLTKRPGEIPGEGELMQVVYSVGRVTVPCDPLDLPPDLLVRKAATWSYEEEWRLVRNLSNCDAVVNGRVHLCTLDAATVARVDIGMSADDATIQAIKQATGPGTPLQHVELYRALTDAGRTNIEFEKIT